MKNLLQRKPAEVLNKNATLLADFTTFCREHPSLRFWQALALWSGNNFVWVGDMRPNAIDTYHSESRDGR